MTGAPAVYTIPPGVSFVDALADGLRQRLGEAPEALAEARILLPTRRACRALTLAFVRRAEGRPLLLPRMTPLGDLDEDDISFDEAAVLVGAAGGEIPPPIPALRRQLLLARHVVRVMGSARTTPAQAAQLAAELGRLFDQIHTERLDIAGLAELVPDELARHWQVTLEFLRPIAAEWQETLRAEGCIDPADRRRRLLEAQAEAWKTAPPSTPVIAAGSTGSQPATADLLAVIAQLPQGAVVLPGLDTCSDAATWRAIDVDKVDPAFPAAQAHPQFGLAQLLRRLGVAREAVRPWPAPGVPDPHPARAGLLARALAPASCGSALPGGDVDAEAVAGVCLLETASPEEEARTIALIMRGVLEQPDRTAALVTPDRALARRVAVELERWRIAVDESGGRPLAETPAAAFLRLIAQTAAEALAPVPLLATLGHPLAAGGMAPAAFRSGVRALERRTLRGLRPAPDIAGLRRAAVGDDAAGHERVSAIIDGIDAVFQPLGRLFEQPAVSAAAILEAQLAAAEALAATDRLPGAQRLWAGDDGEALATFAAELAEALRHDPPIAPAEWPELFDVLLLGHAVRPRWGRHPRLAIWGPLEARLQHADVTILGGLNEESWPPAAQPGPWMSRPMLAAFGLPLPERRIGLSAHDFCQAFAAPEVWLTRATRREGAPTVPCRWLLRLQVLLHGTTWPAASAACAARWLHWQRLLDAPQEIAPVSAPAPVPPVAARPRRLSVTQVEALIRDPYAVYARHVLALHALEPLDAEPGAAHFGTFVHAAISAFLKDGESASDPAQGCARLLEHGRQAFGELLERPAVRAFWWPRFQRIARWFLIEEASRRRDLRATFSEIEGRMEIWAPAGPFLLTAKADRIDRLGDGTLCIVDYKTGQPPKAKEVETGAAPQLPLEAAIARAGGFPDIPAGASVSALEYWHLPGGEAGGSRCPASKKRAADDLAQEAADAMATLVEAFDDPRTPYAARPRPHLVPRFSDYAHLARVKEWTAELEGED